MSNFWWATQNASYYEDFPLGILWAPYLGIDGGKKSHWESLDRVQVQDVVFHYADDHVRAVSVVSRGSMPTKRPYGGWAEQGRSVQTRYVELPSPLPLSEVPLDMRIEADAYGSPFNKNGTPNQGYLFDLPTDFGLWLSDRLNILHESSSPELPDDVNDTPVRAFFDTTDGRVVVNARLEQAALRAGLFKGQTQSDCAICGLVLPVNLLTTAHIKKRSHCDTVERNDQNVVMAACSLGCDALYEKHYIVVDSQGIVRRGNRTATPDMEVQMLAVEGRACVVHSEHNAEYFLWHRQQNALI